MLCICSAFAQKQGQAHIDSLLLEMPKVKEDTNKINILYFLSVDYAQIDPDKGIVFGQEALELADKLHWEKGLAEANNGLGVNYYNKSNHPLALEFYIKALKIFEKIGNKHGISIITGNIGIVYSDLGEFPKALEYYFKALKMNEETGDKNKIASNKSNIGNIYYYQGDFSKALENYDEALKIDEEIGNRNGITDIAGNIATVYTKLNNYPKAFEYSFKALKIAEELGNKYNIAVALGGIGEIYTKQKNYIGAIQFEEIALKLNEEIGARHNIALLYVLIGQAYLSLISDTGAVNMQICTNPASIPYSDNTIQPGWLFETEIPMERSRRLHKAMIYLDSGLTLSKEINERGGISNSYKNLAEAYNLSGSYKKSLDCYLKYMAIEDSFFSKQSNETIVKMEMKFEYDRQRFKDDLIIAQKEQQTTEKLNLQRTITYLSVTIILFLLIFSIFITKERSKSEKLLLNILPAEVASELKSGQPVKARHYTDTTVIFTDFVNFTSASERMSPEALIEELDSCFKVFDGIMTKYNIEKIKTIGDAYLGVCGLPREEPKHAENIVNAAVEILRFINERHTRLGDKTFEIRIGIHTGSVIAGIVGVKKFAYDIWGDTVNTAARMEQNSLPGKINISETTYELVKEKFECEYRGEIEAKNKGKMKMYFVE